MANTTPPQKPGPVGGRPLEAPTILHWLFGRFSHENLAYFFVLALYVAGILLTALLIVQALTWGLLSSFGRVRMMGLLISFASGGLLVSRVIAGRYGNRLASLYMPYTLPLAVSARKLMRDFRLDSTKELTAFLTVRKLHVYSSKAGDRAAETAANLPCTLEPLFTHNMYLPMMRSYFIRTNRLWFDAREVDSLIAAEKECILTLAPSGSPLAPNGPRPAPGNASSYPGRTEA